VVALIPCMDRSSAPSGTGFHVFDRDFMPTQRSRGTAFEVDRGT
jgi:hypothetical protein